MHSFAALTSDVTILSAIEDEAWLLICNLLLVPFWDVIFPNYICITDKLQYLDYRYSIISAGDNMVFKNLRGIREDRDLKQRQLAELLNVSQNTYSQYETGVISLTAEVLIKLADFYGVSIDYLLDRTDNPTP